MELLEDSSMINCMIRGKTSTLPMSKASLVETGLNRRGSVIQKFESATVKPAHPKVPLSAQSMLSESLSSHLRESNIKVEKEDQAATGEQQAALTPGKEERCQRKVVCLTKVENRQSIWSGAEQKPNQHGMELMARP